MGKLITKEGNGQLMKNFEVVVRNLCFDFEELTAGEF